MRALLDCDIFRYQIGSIELEHPFIPSARVPAPVSEIQRIVKDTIEHVIKATGATSYMCVLSGKGNFRNEVAKQEPYKGNRDPSVGRPFHYDTVGDYIRNNYPCIVVDGYEADDWLGIEQRKDIDNTIICSRDKDLGTVHGWHYRWACGENQPERLNHFISEWEAKEFFFHQMLTGDNTDNIMGCGIRKMKKWGGEMKLRREGVGAKAADKILVQCNTVQEMFDAVKLEYERVFGEGHEDVMLENARLLYIGQLPDNLFEWDWLDYDLKRNNDELVRSETDERRIEQCVYQPTEHQPDSSYGECGGDETPY